RPAVLVGTVVLEGEPGSCDRAAHSSRLQGPSRRSWGVEIPSLLESEADAELHLARILCAENPAKIRVAKDPVREIEVGPIQQVEDLPPELERRRTRERPCLRE